MGFCPAENLMPKANLSSFFCELVRLKLRHSNFDPTAMASNRLPNYIRVCRKRLGLSQKEVAFLLGWAGASQPSRYEHFCRRPSLRTALALAVIFRVSVYELFSGEFQKVESAICRQAERLETRLSTEAPDQRTARKLALLKMIISSDGNHS
jgi:transcriptional regulator with XRE-family HTH domain